MSIDATVVGITMLPDGNARLSLEQPDRSRCAGQECLIVEKPLPSNLAILLGKPVWGGDDKLMCGEIEIGKRIGYTGIRLTYDKLIEVASKPLPQGSIDVRELHDFSRKEK